MFVRCRAPGIVISFRNQGGNAEPVSVPQSRDGFFYFQSLLYREFCRKKGLLWKVILNILPERLCLRRPAAQPPSSFDLNPVFIFPKELYHEKMLSNACEIFRRHGRRLSCPRSCHPDELALDLRQGPGRLRPLRTARRHHVRHGHHA